MNSIRKLFSGILHLYYRLILHVWLGNSVYINKGASIGKDSIVAARSVVLGKAFEKNCIIGGIPAKVIKTNTNWDRKLI